MKLFDKRSMHANAVNRAFFNGPHVLSTPYISFEEYDTAFVSHAGTFQVQFGSHKSQNDDVVR